MTGSRRAEKAADAGGPEAMDVDGREASSPPMLAPENTIRTSQGAGKGKRLRPPAPPQDGSEPSSTAGPPAGGGAAAAGADGGAGPDKQNATPGETDGFVRVKAGEVKMPLDPNSKVDCRWKDGQYHTCRILERRLRRDWEGPPEDNMAWEYYVHYHRMNRRMDEWVTPDNFDLTTVEVEVLGEQAEGNRKRKKLEDPHSSDEEHGDFDAQQLREHEEFTKVKNIDKIQLGAHEMDTWYFSPFPAEYNDCKVSMSGWRLVGAAAKYATFATVY
eukprot:jgi/Chrzof1/10157/Cz04g31030.t1